MNVFIHSDGLTELVEADFGLRLGVVGAGVAAGRVLLALYSVLMLEPLHERFVLAGVAECLI